MAGSSTGIDPSSQFCFQEFDHLLSGHPPRGHGVPAPFDHTPNSIRDFVVVRPRWPGPVHHRAHPCNLGHVGERGLLGENLSRMNKLNSAAQRGPPVPPMP